MKTKPECLNCIIDDLIGAIQEEIKEEKLSFEILQESLKFLAKNFSSAVPPSYFITAVHRIFKKVSKIEIPFKERRERSNQVGLKIAERLSKKLKELNDFERFSFLINWAIAANYADFRTVGTGYNFNVEDLEKKFLKCIKEGIKVDNIKEIYKKTKDAKRILFIHDNVGEIAIDKLLIKEIRKYCDKVISVVRGGPITSDATMQDAISVGISGIADEVILAGPDTLGISFKEMSNELKNEINRVDLIFSKGQANYYVFSEYKDRIKNDIVCLFRTKCEIVSSLFGFKEEINIASVI